MTFNKGHQHMKKYPSEDEDEDHMTSFEPNHCPIADRDLISS